jgi:hypothetical protein
MFIRHSASVKVLYTFIYYILGNMWAQQWGNIYDILEPFPGQGRESLTNLMKAQVSYRDITVQQD